MENKKQDQKEKEKEKALELFDLNNIYIEKWIILTVYWVF